MGSSRLPGKTLKNIYKEFSLLACVVRRFRISRCVDDLYVATTIDCRDDPIAAWCDENKINCFRGSEKDVLDRVAGTIAKTDADVIVQMGADSAYIDFELIDKLVGVYIEGNYDYVCNDMKLTYPLGIYAHVVNAGKLLELNCNRELSYEDREGVVRYIFEHPEKYSIFSLTAPDELNYPDMRLTIDYPEDLELAREIYAHFGRFDFTTRDIIELFDEKPEMFAKTKKLIQKSAPFIKTK